MAEELKERFAIVRADSHLNVKQFAESLDMAPTTVSSIESGTREPSKDVLIKLAIRYQVNLNWMLTGEGPPYISGQGLSGPLSALSPSPGLINRNAETMRQFQTLPTSEEQTEANDEERSVTVHRLNGKNALEMAVISADPEIGYVDFYCDQRAGMGPGKDVLDYTESVRLPIIRRFLQPYRPDEVRALEARGDSMSKIGIFDRDIVLYVPDEKEGDGVFVISREGRLQVDANGETALMKAALINAPVEIIDIFVRAGASVNLADNLGRTVLMYAAQYHHDLAIIHTLLNAGANASLEDETGRTALDYIDMNKYLKNTAARKAIKDAMK